MDENTSKERRLKTELVTEKNFNEVAYLIANYDVAFAVMEGRVPSGFSHFIEFGVKERRLQVVTRFSDYDRDRTSLPSSVPISNIASHRNINRLAKDLGGKEGVRFLEVGSRKVTGAVPLRDHIEENGGKYIGFDIYEGENVDIVGDAHRLSEYINEKVDVVYSSAVFEHLAMPWVVATEIAKILNVGGHLLIETHFSYSSHERPWHFFQFSDMALKSLFSSELGFKCIEAGMCNPMVGHFSALSDPYLKRRRINGLFCHSNLYAVKYRDVADFNWHQVDLADVVDSTSYPPPKDRS